MIETRRDCERSVNGGHWLNIFEQVRRKGQMVTVLFARTCCVCMNSGKGCEAVRQRTHTYSDNERQRELEYLDSLKEVGKTR